MIKFLLQKIEFYKGWGEFLIIMDDDIKRNILGLICGYSFIFLNSEMVNNTINKLSSYIIIFPIDSLIVLLFEVLRAILLFISLFGIFIFLFFSIKLMKKILK